MRVRCINNRSTNSLSDDWVTIGREYLVLAVYGDATGIKFRLLSDDDTTPALFEATDFIMLETTLPGDWEFSLSESRSWELSPRQWAKSSFWNSYFDGDPIALKAFDEGLNMMKESRLSDQGVD